MLTKAKRETMNSHRPQDTKVRKRWLCLARRCDGAACSRRTSLPSKSRRERRSGRGGARASPSSAPSTSSSTASERAHIRAATAAPWRVPVRAANPPATARASLARCVYSHARSHPPRGRDSCLSLDTLAPPLRRAASRAPCLSLRNAASLLTLLFYYYFFVGYSVKNLVDRFIGIFKF